MPSALAEVSPGSTQCAPFAAQPVCRYRDLGRIPYAESLSLQRHLVESRKQGAIEDLLLIVEHPHVVTLGRNARTEHLLASPEVLARAGVDLAVTDRGGGVTYHGPGQLVVYPILDLKDWRRDVVAYVRALEQVIVDALAGFGFDASRERGFTGVWIKGRKVAAIGVHLSRWVTSHGFALNLETDLSYFRFIVPCGLTAPVTSLRAEGCDATRAGVTRALVGAFGVVFDRQMLEAPAASAGAGDTRW